MPKKHASLSPSSSKMWLNCPPSAKLNATQEDRASPYAQEGSDAHSLCEHKVLTLLGTPSVDPTPTLEYYNAEMEYHADNYAAFVMEELTQAKAECPDAEILIETRVDFSKWVPEGFGTADCIIVSDGILRVIDFKYGLGIMVDACENPQMKCYALGALALFDGIYDITDIQMTIYQPRRENVSTWTVSKDELLRWAERILAPTALLAIDGKGEFCAGEHCQFCRVKAQCRKRAEYNLELAKYDFEMPSELEDYEVEAILDKVDSLISWASDVKEYALQQALSGKSYENYKVVEGRSTRKYTDEGAVADAVTQAGFDPYEKKLLGITAMSTMLGKKKFDELLSDFICKPQGKPTLVVVTDKRPAINNAGSDFNDMEDN